MQISQSRWVPVHSIGIGFHASAPNCAGARGGTATPCSTTALGILPTLVLACFLLSFICRSIHGCGCDKNCTLKLRHSTETQRNIGDTRRCTPPRWSKGGGTMRGEGRRGTGNTGKQPRPRPSSVCTHCPYTSECTRHICACDIHRWCMEMGIVVCTRRRLSSIITSPRDLHLAFVVRRRSFGHGGAATQA
jgi:hypothetical protein